jgi:hypothetical protein
MLVNKGYTTLGRAGCQEKFSVDANVPTSLHRTRLIALGNDLFPLPTERGKHEGTMSRVHGTIRFPARTERLCVVLMKEDTEEGSGACTASQDGERRKRRSLNLAWLRGMAGVVHAFWCHAFRCFLPHKVLGGSGTRGEHGMPATGKALWPDARASLVALCAALPREGVVCTTAVPARCVAAAPSTPSVMLLRARRGRALTALLPYRLFPHSPYVAQRLQDKTFPRTHDGAAPGPYRRGALTIERVSVRETRAWHSVKMRSATMK